MIEECVIIEQEGGMPVLVTSDTEGRIHWNVCGDEADAAWLQDELPAMSKSRYRVNRGLDYVSAAPGSRPKLAAIQLGLSIRRQRRIERVKRFARMVAAKRLWVRRTRAMVEKVRETYGGQMPYTWTPEHPKEER